MTSSRRFAEIRELGVPLEVCPSSNVALGVVPSLAAHPFPQLVDAGLTVTINTDIPAVVGTSLAEEYRLVRDAFHYDDAVIAELARAAVQASFAPIATKSLLNQGITAWLENHPLPADAG